MNQQNKENEGTEIYNFNKRKKKSKILSQLNEISIQYMDFLMIQKFTKKTPTINFV